MAGLSPDYVPSPPRHRRRCRKGFFTEGFKDDAKGLDTEGVKDDAEGFDMKGSAPAVVRCRITAIAMAAAHKGREGRDDRQREAGKWELHITKYDKTRRCISVVSITA